MPDAPVLSPDPPLVFRVSAGDVVELSLARQLLFRLDLRARRDGELLLVFEPGPETPAGMLYARAGDYPPGSEVGSLYIDEGLYTDCLCGDGAVRVNRPWDELVSMPELLQLLGRLYAPAFPIQPGPYMSVPKNIAFLRRQFELALTGTPQSSHPGVIFVS